MQDPLIKLWDEFLERWPISAIQQMTLDEYGDQSTTDCFTYWVERKLQSLGSIRGSTSFKFGVYKCAKKGPKSPRPGYSFDDEYGWMARLGNSAQEAFVKVKAAVIETIANVQSENLAAIEANDTFGPMFKWKIAFLYQNRSKPICPAIFSEDYLRFATKLDSKATHLELVQALMSQYDGKETIFQYCEKVWSAYEKRFADWFPKDYDPGFSVDDWVNMLNDRELFRDPEDLKVMKRMKHFGGEATCKQLAITYGGNINNYNAVSSTLAERIHKKKNCPVLKEGENENSRWWPILYLGHHAGKDTPGVYVWKLRAELSQALDRVNLDHVALFEDGFGPVAEEPPEGPSCDYDLDRLYQELWMTRNDVDSLLSLVKHKKNVILQGAPGVGKTFTAKRLAYAIMGEVDNSRIKTIQFHQNYSYEDFIMGYKPSEEGFKLRAGVFYEFCQQAAQQPDKDFFFVIDEINRGNLSKILGELMMLIERDHRGEPLTLAYDGKEFAVPKNVFLIGMMNTADRSLALIDYALRRRFSFFEIGPGFETEGFKKHQANVNNEQFDALIKTVKALNEVIVKDDSLGRGFQIAHSYFCKPDDVEDVDAWVKEVVHYDLLPTLSEYWFDDHERFNEWKRKLTDAVNG